MPLVPQNEERRGEVLCRPLYTMAVQVATMLLQYHVIYHFKVTLCKLPQCTKSCHSPHSADATRQVAQVILSGIISPCMLITLTDIVELS